MKSTFKSRWSRKLLIFELGKQSGFGWFQDSSSDLINRLTRFGSSTYDKSLAEAPLTSRKPHVVVGVSQDP